MSTDSIRAALKRLISAYDEHGGKWYQYHEDALHDLVERARADLAAEPLDLDLAEGESSDGYHTFAELYQHRHSLMLALMRALPHLCWFSQRHHDGQLPFGSADWFIVGANLPTGPITYHLPIELLSLARQTGAAELSAGHPWDGHTASDVIVRLRAWVAAAIEPDPAGGGEALLAAAPLQGEEPTTEELNRLYREIYGLHSDVLGPMPRKFARAVLARWGRPAAPAALVEGEVGKLVAWLNVEADLRRNDLSTPTGLNLAQAARQADKLQSWATLLEQQAAAAPAPAEGEVAELVAALRADAECVAAEQPDLMQLTNKQLTRAADLLECLEQVAYAASDFICGTRFPEFANEHGGLDRLMADLCRLVAQFEHGPRPVPGVDVPGPDGDWGGLAELCNAEGVDPRIGVPLLQRAREAWKYASQTAPVPADGEAAELVEWLEETGHVVVDKEDRERFFRAAALLQQQAAELASLRAGIELAAVAVEPSDDELEEVWDLGHLPTDEELANDDGEQDLQFLHTSAYYRWLEEHPSAKDEDQRKRIRAVFNAGRHWGKQQAPQGGEVE